jgi:predicted alpha/beta-hydrolase family hydrolase
VRGGVVLAHGAGGTSLTPFVVRVADGLVAAGWAVLRFDFGYAAVGGRPGRADRDDGPERADYRAAMAALAEVLPPTAPIIAAGKSYGGRVATFLLAEPDRGELRDRVAGLLVFGYPIAPPSGPRPADAAALRSVGRPVLVVQGSRDALGPLAALREALEGIPGAEIAVVEDGDHSFRAPGGREVVTRLEGEAVGAAVHWLEGVG